MYKIVLPIFEGPLDLLLYFIKRDEINIYDIPIARITEEFLSYIKLMQINDIEITSEFLWMASLLMQIKAQMLLPSKQDIDNNPDEDPRKILVEQLIEYQLFKKASEALKSKIDDQHYAFYRGAYESEIKEVADKFKTFKQLTAWDLIKTYYNVLHRNQLIETTEIKINPFKIEDEIDRVKSAVNRKGQISFFELIFGKEKALIVVTFMAVLELVKQKQIFAFQNDDDSQIILFSTAFVNQN
jgi:segregation and condensation protein A